MTGGDIYAEEWEMAALAWHSEDGVIKDTGEKMHSFLHKPSKNPKQD